MSDQCAASWLVNLHAKRRACFCPVCVSPNKWQDFYAEKLAAPDDLKHLTDENESMAFRRRGYEVRGRPGGLPQLLTRACADYTSATPFSKPWLAGLASSI